LQYSNIYGKIKEKREIMKEFILRLYDQNNNILDEIILSCYTEKEAFEESVYFLSDKVDDWSLTEKLRIKTL
jgi:excinuclease UvrABC nuclease subunit